MQIILMKISIFINPPIHSCLEFLVLQILLQKSQQDFLWQLLNVHNALLLEKINIRLVRKYFATESLAHVTIGDRNCAGQRIKIFLPILEYLIFSCLQIKGKIMHLSFCSNLLTTLQITMLGLEAHPL